MKVNILGTEYEIKKIKDDKKMKLLNANGYCEQYSKKIVVDDFDPDEESFENIDLYKNRILRHEIIHAYFFESGLAGNSDFAENEELVDWLAIQIPKIVKTFKELNIIE